MGTYDLSQTPQVGRFKFKRYNGEDNPIVWVSHCEQYFDIFATLEKNKVAIVAYHMDDEAQMWYQLHKNGSSIYFLDRV